MALDFPASPSVGQKYPASPIAGIPTYTWDGEKWKADAGSRPPTIVVADTAPASAPDGALWWESDTGLLYVRYNDGNTTQWVIACPQPDTNALTASVQSAFALRGYISGLNLTWTSATAFTIGAGVACSADATTMMSLAAPLPKTTAAWSLGSSGGGLDTGTIAASTWYHVHLIKRMDTGVVDALISLSPTTPTLPANYTKARRIGSIRTNASSQLINFLQDGDNFYWMVPVADTGSVITTPTLRLLTVPSGVNVVAIISVNATFAGGGGFQTNHWDPALGATLPSPGSGPLYMTMGLASTSTVSASLRVRTNQASQIYNNCGGTVLSGYSLYTEGWIDTRGKDA
jgi:hypothetical protein